MLDAAAISVTLAFLAVAATGKMRENTDKHNNLFMTSVEVTDALKNGTKNFSHVTLQDIKNLNVVDVMNFRYLVISNPEATVEFLQTKLTNK